jgi:hypothetical protein
MTTDYLALAKALADRPSESMLLVHHVGSAKIAAGYIASCSCGESFESAGRDESSRSAVAVWMHDHKAGVR